MIILYTLTNNRAYALCCRTHSEENTNQHSLYGAKIIMNTRQRSANYWCTCISSGVWLEMIAIIGNQIRGLVATNSVIPTTN